MRRRSFLATVLVALGLRKEYNPIIPLGSPLSADEGLHRFNPRPKMINLRIGPDGCVRKIDNSRPVSFRTMPYKFPSRLDVVHFRVGLDGVARPIS